MNLVLVVIGVLFMGKCYGQQANSGLRLPYIGVLPPRTFGVGKVIRIEAQVNAQPNYFVVNLQKGQTFSPYPTITLHFNPRYKDPHSGIIHMNAWHNGNWGAEQTRQLDADFLPGRNFSLVIVCGMVSYDVYVNKKIIAGFPFRVDPEIADTVYVNGDFKLWEVVLEKFSAPLGVQPSFSEGHSSSNFGLQLPYYGILPPKSFDVGKTIRIEAQVDSQPKYFAVNLLRGHTIWPYPTIPLHFNPRYAEPGNSTIHVNAWYNGKWGTEKNRKLDSDFAAGKNFSLVIVFGPKSYDVYVNKKLITEFPYQVSPEIVDTVLITGEIRLWEVAYEGYATTIGEPKSLFPDNVNTVPIYSNTHLGDIREGLSFTVTGYIPPNSERFSISLVLGTTTRDIALLISPHLQQDQILRNSRANNNWGAPEISSSQNFGVHRGSKFSIKITITETCYKIFVNGRHFAEFKHRLPYMAITAVEVRGDVDNIEMSQHYEFSPGSNIIYNNIFDENAQAHYEKISQGEGDQFRLLFPRWQLRIRY